MYQFKGFTEKANKALNLAIESAEEMRHNYVGTEHILYGLVKEGSGVAATALNECGVTEDALREKLESINGTMSLVELTPDDFTPRTKRVLRAAVIISSKTGYTYVGTEHLLLAILSESDSYAVAFLEELGVSVERLAQAVSRGVQMTVSAVLKTSPLRTVHRKAVRPLINSAEILLKLQRTAKLIL